MTAVSPAISAAPLRRTHLVTAVEDTLAVCIRNLTTLRRVPQLLVFSTIQPVVFVLLFR